MVTHEMFSRLRKPHIKKNIIVNAWETERKYKKYIEFKVNKYEIFNINFWAITNETDIDFDIVNRKNKWKIKNNQLIEEVKIKNNLEENLTVMYTDDFRMEESISTGASVVVENQDLAYYSSLPKECSSYSAEAFTIKATIDIIYYDVIPSKENIFILLDCQSVLKCIGNNVNIYESRYIIDILQKRKIYNIWE